MTMFIWETRVAAKRSTQQLRGWTVRTAQGYSSSGYDSTVKSSTSSNLYVVAKLAGVDVVGMSVTGRLDFFLSRSEVEKGKD